MKMMTFGRIILNLFLIIYLLIGCNPYEDEFDTFFEGAEDLLTTNEKLQLINCDSISCAVDFFYESSNEALKNKFDSIPSEIYDSLYSKGIRSNPGVVLFSSFIQYLKKEDIDYLDIQRKMNVFFERDEKLVKQRMKARYAKMDSLAISNYEKYVVGDILSVDLAYMLSGDLPLVIGYSDEDSIHFTRAIEIEGELIDKNLVKEPLPNISIPDQHYFKVVVSQSNFEIFKNASSKKQIGDTVKINLDYYGVRINWRDSVETGSI